MLNELITALNFIYSHPLNAGRKFSAIANFLRWQIGSRLINKRVIIPWVNESRFIVGSGEAGLTGNIYVGFMEYSDMIFMIHVLRESDLFIDVGANVGAYTILASSVVKARSISFEPLPETVERLRDQIHINRIEHLVNIKNMGLSSNKGELCFTNNQDTVNKVVVSGDAENTTRIAVTTLDEEIAGNESFFLKIDVEGFEFNVIQGAKKLLASPNLLALIIELNGSGIEFGHSDGDIHEILTTFGLIPVSYDPIERKLINLRDYNQKIGNTIYIRDFDKINKLCREAEMRTVHTLNCRQI